MPGAIRSPHRQPGSRGRSRRGQGPLVSSVAPPRAKAMPSDPFGVARSVPRRILVPHFVAVERIQAVAGARDPARVIEGGAGENLDLPGEERRPQLGELHRDEAARGGTPEKIPVVARLLSLGRPAPESARAELLRTSLPWAFHVRPSP